MRLKLKDARTLDGHSEDLMSKLCGYKLALMTIAAIGMVYPMASSDSQVIYHTYRNPDVGMPVSLASGSVSTAPFHVKKSTYAIIIQFTKRLPTEEMACMIGETARPVGIWNCNREQMLQADWTVTDQDRRIVAQGAFHQRGMQCVFLKHFIIKYIGYFKGQTGSTYTLAVTFTKDGSALNICDPQLIVMQVKGHDYLD